MNGKERVEAEYSRKNEKEQKQHLGKVYKVACQIYRFCVQCLRTVKK